MIQGRVSKEQNAIDRTGETEWSWEEFQGKQRT
jgi:hypothetical protein